MVKIEKSSWALAYHILLSLVDLFVIGVDLCIVERLRGPRCYPSGPRVILCFSPSGRFQAFASNLLGVPVGFCLPAMNQTVAPRRKIFG
ncbi:hypothetical protein F5887DRAFT_982814 [Amanita rubescens]|nr:hypothetical protein F5887DRAFT_982814 [Amanita rubescens]